jgi:hypothetical protein
MSSFELGVLRATPDLVEGAIQRMKDRIAGARAALENRHNAVGVP